VPDTLSAELTRLQAQVVHRAGRLAGDLGDVLLGLAVQLVGLAADVVELGLRLVGVGADVTGDGHADTPLVIVLRLTFC